MRNQRELRSAAEIIYERCVGNSKIAINLKVNVSPYFFASISHCNPLILVLESPSQRWVSLKL
jgi:hypothetical protein